MDVPDLNLWLSASHLFFCTLLYTARTRSLNAALPKLSHRLTSESPAKGGAGQRLEDRGKKGAVSLLLDLAVTTLGLEATAGDHRVLNQR